MRIKSLSCLQPAEQHADCVVIYADNGTPIFAALHTGETITCAGVADEEFADVLGLLGIEPPDVNEIKIA